MSQWFFNIFFGYRVVRQVNERAAERGMRQRDGNGEDWEIKQVLTAGDKALVAETREYLQHIVNKFERACDNMGLKINIGKSKL